MITPYDIGLTFIAGITLGIVGAAAIGAWVDRRRQGKIPFVVVRHVEPFPWDLQPSEDENEREIYRRRVK